MERKKAGKNSGSAIVVAVVIMMLVMMLSLALLLACYSLRNSAVRQRTMEQCKEIAQGISKELTEEIDISRVRFDKYEDVKAALASNQYPLWCYLRCNLWQTSWLYLNEDEPKHQEADAYKEFTLNYETTEEIPGDVTIAMYWESESGESKENGIVTPFFIKVTCRIGEQKSTITSEYELHIEKNDPNYQPLETEKSYTPTSTAANPQNNTIQLDEKWEIHFVERE